MTLESPVRAVLVGAGPRGTALSEHLIARAELHVVDTHVETYSAALNEVIANGKYAEVLERWGLTNESLPKSEVNPQGCRKADDNA